LLQNTWPPRRRADANDSGLADTPNSEGLREQALSRPGGCGVVAAVLSRKSLRFAREDTRLYSYVSLMISFIVPAYNEELELPSTIAAIHAAASGASQAYEIIVVDDASTDATPEIAVKAGVQVVSINRRQIAAARNAGARAARGKVLFFVDADTRINARHVIDAMAALNAGCSGGSARILADGFQHHVARFIFALLANQAVLDQDSDAVQKVQGKIAMQVGHGLGRLQRAASGEDGQTSEQDLLGLVQETVAPVHGCAECLLPLRQPPSAAGEHSQPTFEPSGKRCRG